MTKKEMIIEIATNTSFKNYDEIICTCSKCKVSKIKEVYSYFLNHKDKAGFCLSLLGY